MAPRLIRWIALTAVAVALVATLFLTTGGVPLLLVGSEMSWPDTPAPQSALSRRIGGTMSALNRARTAIAHQERELSLARILAGTTADPLVVVEAGHGWQVDAVLTREAALVWNSLPDRRDDVRSVVMFAKPRTGGNIRTEIGSTGRCLVEGVWDRRDRAFERALRTRAGLCLFSESFGRPGSGTRAWLSGVYSGLAWDQVPATYRYAYVPDEDERSAAWFASRLESYGYFGGWLWRPVRRAEMACLVGRTDQCGFAAGVTERGRPPLGSIYGYVGLAFPHAALPRDLFHSVGPDRFGEIWRADAPLKTTYARVTGRSMDTWLHTWATGWLGTPRQDNGLSLLGGVGALLWIALLGSLAVGRLKQRAVT